MFPFIEIILKSYELVNKSVSDLTGLHIHNVWEIK